MRVEERRNQRNTRGHDSNLLPMSLSVNLGRAEACANSQKLKD